MAGGPPVSDDGRSAPTKADGSAPAATSAWTSQPAVVLLPCVPATPRASARRPHRRRPAATARRGIPAARAAASSGWSGSIAVSALVTASRSGRGAVVTWAAACSPAIATPSASSAGVYGEGPPGSHPLTTRARLAPPRGRAALAPAPAAPTTWMRSWRRIGSGRPGGRQPGPDRGRPPRSRAVRPPIGGVDPLEQQGQGGRRTQPLVLAPVAGPHVTPDRDADRRRRPRCRSGRPASAGLPPSGPAIPVTATARSAPVRARPPLGHRHRDLGRYRAVRGEDVVGHADRLALELVRVGHEATEVIGARARDLGDEVADEAAGARLDGGDAEPRAEQRSPTCWPGRSARTCRDGPRSAGGERVVRHG